ncbi:MAG: alpha/beta hydrolase [Patescibacteria group bacterium]|nr:alpha/beta hydrolase [Patescibacteria group bacterium]
MQKLRIKNRDGKEIAVLLEGEENTNGLAFVMHGLGGFKEQPHVETFAHSFLEKDFVVVRFDTRDTFGESEGNYEQATITSYLADLEDVIAWAKSQPWYQEPFTLAGHSLGGICTALYAERHPEQVIALAPISTVVSGELSAEAKTETNELAKWQETGWRETPSKSKSGIIKRLPWSHMEDRMKYDLLPGVSRLTMPTLLIVGSVDDTTPPKHQKILLDALPGPKELHIIEGAPHTFRNPAHLKEIADIFAHWIDSWQA